ncbi:MAG TPA: type II CAAX endopeptidase family protein [Bryobacteraceae bacterium]|nr:type II CAAX endopeptidase family protein [Bryobacteraceae bacterium]
MKRQLSPVPLFTALAFASIYWFTDRVVATIAQFLGREMVALTVPTLVAAAISGAIAMAIFESRKLSDLGLHWNGNAGHNFLAGLAAGVIGAGALIFPSILFGFAHFETATGAGPTVRGAIFTMALLFCGAAGEEIVFRGFPLQALMRGYGNWVSILVVGVLFGVMHQFNPGATTLSNINTAGFGILFGIALFRSHDLWLPIGLHFGWNATLPFLGSPLSGFTIRVTEYQLVWKAGVLWSGGSYGPEASLLASLVLLLLGWVVWKMPVRKDRAWLLDSVDSEPV